jgi:hypothetical protein
MCARVQDVSVSSGSNDDEPAVTTFPPDKPSLTAQVVAGGVVAVATATMGPPGAVAGAVLTPVVADLYSKAAAEWRSQSAEKADAVLADAAAAGQRTVAELFEEIGEDEDKLLLLAQAVEAAMRTRNQAKVRALGGALASGALAEDRARVDAAQLRVNILRELEAPHFRVLALIAEKSSHTMGVWRGRQESELHQLIAGDEGPRTAGVLQPILRVLDRNGPIYLSAVGELWDENMADDIRPDAGTNQWTVTNFGRSLLEDVTGEVVLASDTP